MPVDRALPAAHNPGSRFSLVVATIGGGSSPMLRLGLPVVVATVGCLTLLVGSGFGGPRTQQQRAAPQKAAAAKPVDAVWYRAEKGDAASQFSLGFGYQARKEYVQAVA
jgi:hypothetical protein